MTEPRRRELLPDFSFTTEDDLLPVPSLRDWLVALLAVVLFLLAQAVTDPAAWF